jgi:hypothetical protein
LISITSRFTEIGEAFFRDFLKKPPEGNDGNGGTSFVRKHPPSAPMPQKDALRIPPDESDLLEHVPSGTAREKLMKGTNGKP